MEGCIFLLIVLLNNLHIYHTTVILIIAGFLCIIYELAGLFLPHFNTFDIKDLLSVALGIVVAYLLKLKVNSKYE